MRIIGLTGGIGMGKSTASAIFRRARIPVFDADAVVHRLQGPGGAALHAIETAFPGTVARAPGGPRLLDRAALRARVLADPRALETLESIVHPLVRRAERAFVARARRAGAWLVVLDIPLLFESGMDARVNTVVVVSAPRAVQIARVRRRRSMDTAQILAVIARQMPDLERRRRADEVVCTGLSRHHAQVAIRHLIGKLRHDPLRPVRHGNHRP